jgi:hypothetical protein
MRCPVENCRGRLLAAAHNGQHRAPAQVGECPIDLSTVLACTMVNVDGMITSIWDGGTTDGLRNPLGVFYAPAPEGT